MLQWAGPMRSTPLIEELSSGVKSFPSSEELLAMAEDSLRWMKVLPLQNGTVESNQCILLFFKQHSCPHYRDLYLKRIN